MSRSSLFQAGWGSGVSLKPPGEAVVQALPRAFAVGYAWSVRILCILTVLATPLALLTEYKIRGSGGVLLEGVAMLPVLLVVAYVFARVNDRIAMLGVYVVGDSIRVVRLLRTIDLHRSELSFVRVDEGIVGSISLVAVRQNGEPEVLVRDIWGPTKRRSMRIASRAERALASWLSGRE